MSRGVFITFEGGEGCGKSTHIGLLEERLRSEGRALTRLREPGGTAIGEEMRHLFQHNEVVHAMTPETELLLVNASRAQLVREVIRPALTIGQVVICDRFYDSTVAYQGYGRGLDLKMVQSVIDVAVGETRPDRTFLLRTPLELSERRMRRRAEAAEARKDRMEEADREFYERVERGFEAIAAGSPGRIQVVDSSRAMEEVHDEIWRSAAALLKGGAGDSEAAK